MCSEIRPKAVLSMHINHLIISCATLQGTTVAHKHHNENVENVRSSAQTTECRKWSKLLCITVTYIINALLLLTQKKFPHVNNSGNTEKDKINI